MAGLEVCLCSPQLLWTCESKKKIEKQGSNSPKHLSPFNSFGTVLIPAFYHASLPAQGNGSWEHQAEESRSVHSAPGFGEVLLHPGASNEKDIGGLKRKRTLGKEAGRNMAGVRSF